MVKVWVLSAILPVEVKANNETVEPEIEDDWNAWDALTCRSEKLLSTSSYDIDLPNLSLKFIAILYI